jgi:hypothetical protein
MNLLSDLLTLQRKFDELEKRLDERFLALEKGTAILSSEFKAELKAEAVSTAREAAGEHISSTLKKFATR